MSQISLQQPLKTHGVLGHPSELELLASNLCSEGWGYSNADGLKDTSRCNRLLGFQEFQVSRPAIHAGKAPLPHAHTHAHTHTHFFHTPCPITDIGQVQTKAWNLEPVYSQLKSSIDEVASLTPNFTLDLRAAGCLTIDGHRWPLIPQPSLAQGVRWKMVERRPKTTVYGLLELRWSISASNTSGAFC